jgi:hypothetical protein
MLAEQLKLGGRRAIPRKEESQVKKIVIRKAGAVKLTGAMRPLYSMACYT